MTEVNEQQQESTEEVRHAGGPGRHLREARESRNLTTEQAAAQLRMQVRIIEALENDDYSDLPGATFVQGYLRSYSRMLGLSEENILALMPLEAEETQLVGSIDQGKAEITSQDLPFRMMSILILVVAVAGIGWWLSQREPVLDTMPSPVVHPDGSQELLLPVEEPVTQEEPSESLPNEAAESDETVPAEESESGAADEAVDTAEVTQPAEPVVVREPAPMVVEQEAPSLPQLTAEIPQSELVLEYQADSWTEVTDAIGRKLVYGLIPAGKILSLKGEAPFKLFLGFAPSVTVYYNGDLYDHTPYQRGDVARFRIGRAEHNRPVSR